MTKKIERLRFIMVALLLALVVFICFLLNMDDTSRTDIQSVTTAVTASMDVSALKKSSNQMFKRLYGLNVNDYDGVSLYYSDYIMNVDELLIVKVKTDAQMDEVYAAVEKRLETQLKSFDGYGTDQTKRLNDHILQIKGNYLFFIVSHNAAKAQAAFLKSL